MKILRVVIVTVAFIFIFVDSRNLRRVKRTIVTGNTAANADGNITDTGNTVLGLQGQDGGMGVNFTSQGAANGSQMITITNNGAGAVDYQNGTLDLSSGQGNVGAAGGQAAGSSNIGGFVLGNNQSINSNQQGSAGGVGPSSAMMNGSATSLQNGQVSPFSTNNVQISASANGALTGANVISNQNINWDQIIAQLAGNSSALDENNAGVLVNVGATNNNGNGISVTGMMNSIANGTGGNATAEANGNAQLMNNTQNTGINLYGDAAGQGDTSLNGVGQLSTLNDGTNQTLQVTGSGNAGIDQGQSSVDSTLGGMLNSDTGGQAMNHINVTADAPNKNLTISNGILVNDMNGQTLSAGGGQAQGVGSQNSSAIMTVDTQYNPMGDTSVVVMGDGTAVSHNSTSALILNANGQVVSSDGTNNTGSAMAAGTASGEYNNVTGNAFLSIDKVGSNGNSYVDAFGGGKGNSNANTIATLQLNDAMAGARNYSVLGAISAIGTESTAHSISGISDYAGMPTFTSYQNSTATGEGSSSSSISSHINIKRKKRQSQNKNASRLPDADNFHITKICPDAENSQINCPLFTKVYDRITGEASWELIELGDVVKLLYGYPESSFSTNAVSSEHDTNARKTFNEKVLIFAEQNSKSALMSNRRTDVVALTAQERSGKIKPEWSIVDY